MTDSDRSPVDSWRPLGEQRAESRLGTPICGANRAAGLKLTTARPSDPTGVSPDPPLLTSSRLNLSVCFHIEPKGRCFQPSTKYK